MCALACKGRSGKAGTSVFRGDLARLFVTTYRHSEKQVPTYMLRSGYVLAILALPGYRLRCYTNSLTAEHFGWMVVEL